MILTIYNTEIYVITLGTVVNQVLSGTQVFGGLNFAISMPEITRDVSGYEDANYRQLDTRVFSIF
jgi:hypothetical protein